MLTPEDATRDLLDLPDAIAIMWFEDTDSIAVAFGSEVGKRLIDDTPRFCGAAASFEIDEQILFDHGALPWERGF